MSDEYLTGSPFDADAFEVPEEERSPWSAEELAAAVVEHVDPRPRSLATVRPEPAPGQTTLPDAPPLRDRVRTQPVALVYPSKEDGTGWGHVVIVQANGELTCTCWPGLRTARGCHAMADARALLGLPVVT